MTVAPNPVLIHRSRLPFRYPRRSLLRWYGPAANTSASSASANFNITSRTLPRNASLNRSGPKRPSIWLKHCILFPIGVFLLGLTLPMSQILFWDTERIRLLYFPQQAGRRHVSWRTLNILRLSNTLRVLWRVVKTFGRVNIRHIVLYPTNNTNPSGRCNPFVWELARGLLCVL